MSPEFEEQYQDVLQNIEFALVNTYRAHEEMTDYDAEKVISSLIQVYQAESSGRPASALRLQPVAQEAYDGVKAMCDWRLGREALANEKNKPVNLGMEPKTLDEIIACLKRVRKSVQRWQKQGGRRGYFHFIDQFLP